MYCLHNLGQFNFVLSQGFCLFRIIQPRKRFERIRGLSLKYFVVYRNFPDDNLTRNIGFSMQKPTVFRAGFPILHVGAVVAARQKGNAAR